MGESLQQWIISIMIYHSTIAKSKEKSVVLRAKSSGHYAQGEEYVYKEQIKAMVVNVRAPAVSSEVGEWRSATVESVVQTASLL
jgi:hypothetical protein